MTAAMASGEVVVRTEQLNPADPAWKFKTIPCPSKSDIAHGATVTLAGNQFDPLGGDGSVLVNGHLPNDPLDLREEAFFSMANTAGGSITVDLGQVQPVAAVCSYSWHENPPDQGCRGPQVYTLSGSTDGRKWTKLADVDTRPNKTGQNWNGQHGAYVADKSGKLGDFQFLKFDVQRTGSPMQPDARGAATLFSEINVHTQATLAMAGDADIPKLVKVTDVWVAFKTHFDIGYTDTVSNVLQRYRVTMMDGALPIFEQDRQLPPEKRFSWLVPGWPLKHILGPLQDPARKARIEQAVREGSLSPIATPFTLHTETEDLEDIVRGLGYSSAICRQYGRPLPITAKMTDVPGHSWVWPTVLHHAGVKFFQIGTNGCNGHLRVPHLFWWEGPDGSRILCNFTPQYGSDITPPRDWPAHNYLAMIMAGDNVGPPSPADVENLRREAAKRLPGVRIHFGTLDDFARALAAENPDLPVVRGDMPDTWVHGWMSMPAESNLAHSIRPFQPVLDSLDRELRLWGLPTDDAASALAAAYEQSHLYSEHTFGPGGPCGGSWNTNLPRFLYGEDWKKAQASGAYKAYENVFNDKREYARQEVAIVRRELKTRLDLLARNVSANGKRVVVWNGLPWPRSGTVEVSGRQIYVENVPASGYKTLAVDKDKYDAPSPGGDTLDTPFYRVIFDLKRGGIASLVERKSGRELVDQTSPHVLGQFLHERFEQPQLEAYARSYAKAMGNIFANTDMPRDIRYAALTPTAWSIAWQRTEAADIATLTATDTLGLAKGIAIVATIFRHQPTVDIEWRVTGKTPDPIPEGGWLCFPFAVAQPHFTLGRLAGPIDPLKDIIAGANKHYLCLNTGLTISSADGAGVGLCPVDSPCVSLGEPGLNKFSFDYVPKTPAVFVNLYNNVWRTNFPEWQGGTWTSRVRIWPTPDLAVPSWEARVPLLAAEADGPAGKLPQEQSGVSVSRPGVLVTAFGRNPDGDGTLLRIWEQSGKSGEVTVKIPGGFTTASPVNLRGEKTGTPAAIRSHKLVLDLGAYAPASYILE